MVYCLVWFHGLFVFLCNSSAEIFVDSLVFVVLVLMFCFQIAVITEVGAITLVPQTVLWQACCHDFRTWGPFWHLGDILGCHGSSTKYTRGFSNLICLDLGTVSGSYFKGLCINEG